MTEETHSFRRGTKHIKEAASRGSNFEGSDTHWFKWEDGETKYVRLLFDGDDIITVALHEFVECVDNKKRPFVCRKEFGDSCELCGVEGVRRRDLGFAIAVEREERRDEAGKVNGYADKLDQKQVEENGQTKTKAVPIVGIIRQGPKNFWAWFDAFYERNGTLLDYDFEVVRRGGGTDTDYVKFYSPPLPIENLQERYKKYVPDLEGMLNRMGAREYYDKYLHNAKGGDTEIATGLPSDDTEFERRLKEQKEQLSQTAKAYD